MRFKYSFVRLLTTGMAIRLVVDTNLQVDIFIFDIPIPYLIFIFFSSVVDVNEYVVPNKIHTNNGI